MRIAELFESIQGEGMLAGVPSVFIRTSGCNLRCRWCDTPYTSWNPEGDEKSIENIVSFVRQHRSRHVVLTGGEPMIVPRVAELTAALRAEECHITIETAGTVEAPVVCDLMSISPKLRNSTPDAAVAGDWAVRHEDTRIQPDVLRNLIQNFNYQLKFVVAAPDDAIEIRELVTSLAAPAGRVILMPEGRTREEIAGRSGWVADLCCAEGWRYSPRLHIDLWGNKRGV